MNMEQLQKHPSDKLDVSETNDPVEVGGGVDCDTGVVLVGVVVLLGVVAVFVVEGVDVDGDDVALSGVVVQPLFCNSALAIAFCAGVW